MPAKNRLVIIDGNAIIHRAYHALPPLTVKDGTMVNAVFGFTSMLLKVMRELKPTHLAVCFDVAGPTFRDKLYEAYKAKRVKADQELYNQIPLVYKVVEAFGIPIYTKEGFEADDVIGTITLNSRLQTPSSETIVVTGDMDMLQLVDKRTKVYELRKGLSDIVLFDEKRVREKYGFGPEMVVDYKALRGDPSDNIPGVKGIGEQGAKELLAKIGGVEDIYKQLQTPNSKLLTDFKSGVVNKLRAGKADAALSRALAAIRRDVKGLGFKLERCRFQLADLDRDQIKELFKKFEFFSLLKRLPGEGGTVSPGAADRSAVVRREAVGGSRRLGNWQTVNDEQGLEVFFQSLKTEREFASREVLSGKDVMTSELKGLVFTVRSGSYYVDLDRIKAREKLWEIFGSDSKLLIGHDLKQLVKALRRHGIEIKNRLFDVMVASYVVNSSTRAHDLKSLVLRELGEEWPSVNDQVSLFGPDPLAAAEELALTLKLKEKFVQALEKFEDVGLFEKLEMRLVPVLAEMELNGVAIDEARLGELSREVGAAIKKVTKKIQQAAGEKFNVASSVQLRAVLFEHLQLPAAGIKKGKTGYSTAASELEKLGGAHPIIGLVEEHRELAKLQNTYIDVLPKLVNKSTGRIHTSFNQTVAATGRLSSSDPNLQNIPIRTPLGAEVRKAFVAERGYTLVSADYSQIELRIVASLAQDKRLMEIFKKGEDVHLATAAAINGVPMEKVTRAMRYAAKEVNFGVLYGMGAFGLAWRASIPQWQAKEFIDKYFREFAGVKQWIETTLKFAKEAGYVETLFGRRRYIPELKSDNFQLRGAGERMAINMPIQGTAADLMKLAMIEVCQHLHATAWPPTDVKLILQVHDELVFEVKNGLEDEVGHLVKKTMEGVAELRVPIEVRVSSGRRWGELK